ncbi:hypothetical protein CHUAL_009077 [Chamberlinius hualienensis]
MKFVFFALLVVLPSVFSIEDSSVKCPMAPVLSHYNDSAIDCISMATKSLDEDSANRVQNVVWRIIKGKRGDDLNDEDLTSLEKSKSIAAYYCFLLQQIKAAPTFSTMVYDCLMKEESSDDDCVLKKVKKHPECASFFKKDKRSAKSPVAEVMEMHYSEKNDFFDASKLALKRMNF